MTQPIETRHTLLDCTVLFGEPCLVHAAEQAAAAAASSGGPVDGAGGPATHGPDGGPSELEELRRYAATAHGEEAWQSAMSAIAERDAEIDRLRAALTRRDEPVSSEWLTRLHKRAHQQPNRRTWRIIDTLVHHVDRLTLRIAELEATR